MEAIRALSRKQILGIVGVLLLIVGLAIGVYLVQRQQKMKSRAVTTPPGSFVNAFDIRDRDTNSPIPCSTSDPPVCGPIRDLNITVRVGSTAPLLP